MNFVKKIWGLLISAILMTTSVSNVAAKSTVKSETQEKVSVVSKVKDQDYKLTKMVILSRHNVRSPLSTKGSDLYKLTPHKWINWTSDAGELSLRGGDLETLMGQYFRKYLTRKGLITENEQPDNKEVRFYANSMQRTIATAQYFSSGFLPVANAKIEYHNKLGTMDPVFSPQLTFLNSNFKNQAMDEIAQMGGKKGLAGIEKNLNKNYKLLAKVLDLKHSEKAKTMGYHKFPVNDLTINFKLNQEPSMTGSLKVATTAADALVLQYYEAPNAVKAAFGKRLTIKQWQEIAKITDTYGKVLFKANSVAVNVAHPMLKEIQSELTNNRKFSFLCGHDSNIASVLAALNVKKYQLPNSIEPTTPIGSKVVMEEWSNSNGQKFITFKLVYFSINQLRHLQAINLQNPPMIYDLSFIGLNKNKDGMYNYNDVMNRLNQAITSYNTLSQK